MTQENNVKSTFLLFSLLYFSPIFQNGKNIRLIEKQEMTNTVLSQEIEISENKNKTAVLTSILHREWNKKINSSQESP